MSAMSTTTPAFPVAKRRGYSHDQVDSFLARARAAFDGADVGFGAAEVRRAAFDLVQGGYEIAVVDEALERLENVFAERERREARSKFGDSEYLGRMKAFAQEIIDRLGRGDGERFTRVSPLTFGYSRREVDRFSRRLIRYFEDGAPVAVEEVRRVTFRPQRGGYAEGQVDAVLDAVVEVMLAVR